MSSARGARFVRCYGLMELHLRGSSVSSVTAIQRITYHLSTRRRRNAHRYQHVELTKALGRPMPMGFHLSIPPCWILSHDWSVCDNNSRGRNRRPRPFSATRALRWIWTLPRTVKREQGYHCRRVAERNLLGRYGGAAQTAAVFSLCTILKWTDSAYLPPYGEAVHMRQP